MDTKTKKYVIAEIPGAQAIEFKEQDYSWERLLGQLGVTEMSLVFDSTFSYHPTRSIVEQITPLYEDNEYIVGYKEALNKVTPQYVTQCVAETAESISEHLWSHWMGEWSSDFRRIRLTGWNTVLNTLSLRRCSLSHLLRLLYEANLPLLCRINLRQGKWWRGAKGSLAILSLGHTSNEARTHSHWIQAALLQDNLAETTNRLFPDHPYWLRKHFGRRIAGLIVNGNTHSAPVPATSKADSTIVWGMNERNLPMSIPLEGNHTHQHYGIVLGSSMVDSDQLATILSFRHLMLAECDAILIDSLGANVKMAMRMSQTGKSHFHVYRANVQRSVTDLVDFDQPETHLSVIDASKVVHEQQFIRLIAESIRATMQSQNERTKILSINDASRIFYDAKFLKRVVNYLQKEHNPRTTIWFSLETIPALGNPGQYNHEKHVLTWLREADFIVALQVSKYAASLIAHARGLSDEAKQTLTQYNAQSTGYGCVIQGENLMSFTPLITDIERATVYDLDTWHLASTEIDL